VQRGSPAWKLFTNFYSFFNTTYNLTREAVGRTNFRSVSSEGLLAADSRSSTRSRRCWAR
jgi:hypothetical protein